MLWGIVRGFNRVFCKSISIPAYNVIDVVVSIDVTDACANDVFVHLSRMWLVYCFSRFRFACVKVGSPFCLVWFLVTTAIRLRR